MMRTRRRYRTAFIFGLIVIWALFLPRVGHHGFVIDWRPPLALLALLGLLAFVGLAWRRLWRPLHWLLAALLLTLAVLKFGDAMVERVLNRPLNLYFDIRYVPDLLGLYVDATGVWRGTAVIAGVAVAFVAVFALVMRSIAGIERAMARPGIAVGSILVALAGFALIAVPQSLGGSLVDLGGTRATWQQARSAWRDFAALHGIDSRYAAALSTPQPPTRPLPGLKGHDVFLVFVESYGTVVLDQPRYRAVVGPELKDFAATVAKAGYHLVSSRLVSPTFGGGSWLAHGTLASGIKLDQPLYDLLVNSHRKTLPRYMAAAGYRTVEVMPGIKSPYPEAAFWDFNENDYAAQLGYRGPPFGWFGIPDQYTLAWFDAHDLEPEHGPLFAQIVLVSSHTPFAPVPPYLPDWHDVGKFATVPHAEWKKIYAQPDWADLDRPYLDSVVYVFKTLGAWLSGIKGHALVVILGDHEPPGLTLGSRSEPWTVPVYVLSRDPDLVRPFERRGYVAGDLPPPRAKPEGMEKFLGEFLAAYGPSGSRVAARGSAPPQSPGVQTVSRP